jgi:hypothetical protein
MSKELLSPGNDFVVEQYDRGYGSRPTEVFKISGDDGTVTLNGVELTGDQTIVGALQTSGNASVGGNLAVTGTSVFTGAVTLPSNTVTGAELATALSAKIPMTATLSVAAFATDHHDVTIQLKDAAGTNMALACRISVWLSDSAKGTPVGAGTTGLTTTFTTGTIALTKLSNLDFDVISDGSGVIVCRVTDTNGTETRYVNVAVNGVVYASAAVTSGS